MKLNRKIQNLIFVVLLTAPVVNAYDWDHSLSGYVTRCFQVSNIKVECDDLSEPAWGIRERAELNIEALDLNGNRFFYGYLKGIEGPLCKEHLRKIRRLLKNNTQACITGWGESGSPEEITSHWQALRTKSGNLSW